MGPGPAFSCLDLQDPKLYLHAGVFAGLWPVSQRRHRSAQVLRGHPSTDLGSFSAIVEYPWKPSSYVAPGDAAEDAAAAFLRTAWLTEYKGNPAPDEMWGCAMAGLWLRNSYLGSEPQGLSPYNVSSRVGNRDPGL